MRAVGAICVGLVLLAACSGGLSAEGRKKNAYHACQQYITDDLTSPATAIWPKVGDDGLTFVFVNHDRKVYIAGHVDSQNSYGALVRSKVACVLTTKDGKAWSKYAAFAA